MWRECAHDEKCNKNVPSITRTMKDKSPQFENIHHAHVHTTEQDELTQKRKGKHERKLNIHDAYTQQNGACTQQIT